MKKTPILVIFLLTLVFGVPLSARALTVSPARLEVSGDPGQTVRGEILLSEEAVSNKNYFISFENFEPRGDSGAPYFIGAKTGLATWIQAPSEISISGTEEYSVPFSITIPSSAKPGGYFAAIFFGNQPVNGIDGGQVSVGGKVGVLILLRVNGEIEEGGGLVSFSLKDEKRVLTVPPVILEYRFNNTGGDRVVPRGTVTVLNTFRFKKGEWNANSNEGSVLPGSARRFEVIASGEDVLVTEQEPLDNSFFDTVKIQLKDFKLGWYTAKLDIEWGETKQNAQEKYHFFVFPWQALVVIFALLFVCMKVLKMMLRRYNKWILAQAGIYQRVDTHQQKPSVQQIKNISHQERQSSPLVKQQKDNSLHRQTEKPLQKPRRRI